MMSHRARLILGCAILLLSACGSVREDLGLGRNPPDEFAVMDRPPLSIPPDFALRPPQPGAARPQEIDTSQRASAVLFADQKKTAATGESNGEKALLSAASAADADPSIRQKVDREASQKIVGNDHLVEDLLWWKKDEKPGTTVDATSEATRIQNAKDQNQPLNQTATPVIEKQQSGWLGL